MPIFNTSLAKDNLPQKNPHTFFINFNTKSAVEKIPFCFNIIAGKCDKYYNIGVIYHNRGSERYDKHSHKS